MNIKELSKEEICFALELVWEVFLEFEAPDYSQEGIEEFHHFIQNEKEMDKLRFFGAFQETFLLGVLAMRQTHICLLFVKKEFHRKGIAKSLFQAVLEQIKSETITVNSAPYAVEIYQKLGFLPAGPEQTTNGIRSTSMVYTRE
ncbi:GNAT family N-acetyltransferase [Anaeromassilibacillus senegalensis]|uniref:GNAT family N-acetyltransferase n=1 Tax=Anaeromassilibacillus senegalensis TaxID=1673717 RepID=UPI00068220C6|nr:GNAT family N-acetyltransferase [Anaeromassilibacillus senegalensis]